MKGSLARVSAFMPDVAVELAGHRIAALRLEPRSGRMVVTASGEEALPEGMLVPSLTTANVKDQGGVRAALDRVLAKVGRPRRVALIVPDPVAKVSVMRFEQVPPRRQDLDQLIRWQVRKAAPFPLDEAQIAYAPGLIASDGQDFIVTVARRDVVLEYESLCASSGAHAGIVDLSTFNVINGLLAAAPPVSSDWLVVNVAPAWASIAVMRGADPILFRSRSADAEGSLEDIVHQTSMYYEDRLNGHGFERVALTGTPSVGPSVSAGLEGLRHGLAERLGMQIVPVDVRAMVEENDSDGPDVNAQLALIGLLVRDRRAVA